MRSLGLFIGMLLFSGQLAAQGDPTQELTLFFTGYVHGNFEPCG